jgi:cobalt-zinc-cadmium efflux system outer membrane protein
LARPALAQLSLAQALRAARAHSLHLQAEHRAVEQARAATVAAAARPNPEVNLQPIQLTDRALHAENTGFFHPANQQLWFQVAKNLQVAGQRQHKIQLAQANLRLRDWERADVATEHYRQVAHLWLHGWHKWKQIQILGYETADIERVLVFLRQQGLPPESSEMVRASLIKAQYQARLNLLRTEYENLLAALQLGTGLTALASIDTVAPVRGLAVPLQRDSLFSFALARRPQVGAARQMQQVAASRQRLEKANRWGQPTLGLIYNPQNLVPYWGVYAIVPIPALDRKVGERQMAQQELERAKLLTNLAEQRLAVDLANAWRDYETAQQNARLVPPLLPRLEQDFERIKAVFFRGQNELTLLNFLEAERELYEAQLLQLEYEVAQYQALVELLSVSQVLASLAEAE